MSTHAVRSESEVVVGERTIDELELSFAGQCRWEPRFKARTSNVYVDNNKKSIRPETSAQTSSNPPLKEPDGGIYSPVAALQDIRLHTLQHIEQARQRTPSWRTIRRWRRLARVSGQCHEVTHLMLTDMQCRHIWSRLQSPRPLHARSPHCRPQKDPPGSRR